MCHIFGHVSPSAQSVSQLLSLQVSLSELCQGSHLVLQVEGRVSTEIGAENPKNVFFLFIQKSQKITLFFRKSESFENIFFTTKKNSPMY